MTQIERTHPFSLEKPIFELERHDVHYHDETDVYGVDHELVFKSGDPADVYAFSSGIVRIRVGGALNNPENGGTKVGYNAFVHFPRIREVHLEGSLVSDIEPEHEELKVLASSMMAILANKKIVA